MQLSKIKIKNYRLLIDAELEVDPRTTLIVGRNNTAKTSCFSCIGKVLDGETVSFDDYPLLRREDFYTKIALFMEKKLTYEDLCKQIKIISIEFLVDYSLDDPDDNLGALSPFIIDVDVDTTTALIRAEYRLKSDEKTLWTLLESSYYKDGAFSNKVTEKIKQETPADEELKVLMITHKVLATQQGYEKLLDILNDGLRDKEDPFLLFFMETVEPIYHALNTSDMQLLFDILGIKRYPITKKAEKNKWKELQRQLDEARKKRAIDVFEIINRTKLIPISPKLDGWYHLYQNTPETIYASNTSIEAFLNLDYAQFIAVKDFLHPEAQYSTEHGVKGEEYDNVILVISKGWNQYQFETYAPMITKKAVIPSGKQASFERNRNLFYVCCSRPKKRLIFFVTVPIDSTFKSFLVELVGEQNIFTFSQYIERKIN